MQAVNGGKATYFGIENPFDLNTLLGVVSIDFGGMMRGSGVVKCQYDSWAGIVCGEAGGEM